MCTDEHHGLGLVVAVVAAIAYFVLVGTATAGAVVVGRGGDPDDA